MTELTELQACTPSPLLVDGFNPKAKLPYQLTTGHVRVAMGEFIDFLGFINRQFSGRSETSRRTITASVTESGYEKMMANWIYEGLKV